MVLSRPNIRYIPPYLPYLLNYLLIWVKTVTYFYEPYHAAKMIDANRKMQLLVLRI